MGNAAPQIVEGRLWHADLEDEQRVRDREHAIAERLCPAGAPVLVHCALPRVLRFDLCGLFQLDLGDEPAF